MRPRTIYRLCLPFTVVSSVVNITLCCIVFFRIRRPFDYSVRIVEPPRPPSFDGVPLSGLSGTSISNAVDIAASSHTTSRSVYRLPFQVFKAGGRTYAEIGGIYYQVGDLHAYGVISRIFPERIVLSDGCFIDNIKFNGGIQNESRASSGTS